MSSYYLTNGIFVNEGTVWHGGLLIEDGIIKKIVQSSNQPVLPENCKIIDLQKKLVIPGIIDDQVHFREPGLTHKADIYTESKAAVAGGITSFMEMPNTNPQTTTIDLLEEKFAIAQQKSLANYSFYLGATNDNISEIRKVNPRTICGVKVFMGSSTGNMLVDSYDSLNRIFAESPVLVATHCEEERLIQSNLAYYKEEYGDNIPLRFHPIIRSEEACYQSSAKAVELAVKHNTKLHVLHISTARELSLFDNTKPLHEKRITAEVCVHHLFFDDSCYETHGSLIRWNPAIKTLNDRLALQEALVQNKLDVIATDHAPHTIEEKNKVYAQAASGGPLVQHALVAMLELYHQEKISIPLIVEK
ncbi:MAG: dihydroorotase, partial [Bacteroidales bacterium]